ncbi:MAG: hypothetical protein QOE54_3036, partial [Streptosporangiaceae bacterium]|nr:hypothetical protein [Streptosporangiaceae bacterium]
GPSYNKQQFDDSYQAEIQPGSSFKPYVLATALSQGYGLKSLVNGNTPQTIQGVPFTNDSKSEQGVFDFVKMTAKSINTAYVWLGTKVGLSNVVDTAVKSGIPASSKGMNAHVLSLPLGPNLISPIDQASGYSTFANNGTHIETHVIKSIYAPDNGKPAAKLVKLRRWKTTTAFTSDVAKDATYALQAVVRPGGTGTLAALPDGRPVAGKTGTTSGNVSAWFSGYTPQLSTAVAMWRQSGNKQLPLTGIGGYSQIYGGTIPAETFSRFMTKALEGKEVKQFDPPVYGGTTQKWATPKPTPTPTLTVPTPSTTPPCIPGGLGGSGQGGKPCVSNSPTVPASGQPCNQFGLPVGCDPNKPPSTPPPTWFCNNYTANHNGQIYKGCPTKGGPGTGTGTGNPGNGRTQTVVLARTDE